MRGAKNYWKSNMNKSPILSITNLCIIKKKADSIFHKYDNEFSRTGYLVNGLNMVVAKNNIHGIVGESGSGKSLAMKSVLGIIDFAPGIVNGNIRIYKDGDYTEIIKDMAPNKKWNITLPNQTRVLCTEYFNISSSEQTVKLAHQPVVPSLLIYCFNSKLHSLEVVEYEVLNVSSKTLLKLNIPFNHEKNKFIIASYSFESLSSSYGNRRKINSIQKSANIRGRRVSMILQDPKSFLNPFWTIEYQLKNLLENRFNINGDEFVINRERNFTIWLTGTDNEFPIRPEWDMEDFKKKYSKAELWVRGERFDLLESGQPILIQGSSHFWGINTVGRKFDFEIFPASDDDINIAVKWDDDITENIQSAIMIIDPLNDGHEIRLNLLKESSVIIVKKLINQNETVTGKIETILGSSKNFEGEILISTATHGQQVLRFGIDEDATDGLDPHKGEIPLEIIPGQFTAGFIIWDNNEKVMTSVDIKSPVKMVIAEITLTVTPKYPDNLMSDLNFISEKFANKKTGVSFGFRDDPTYSDINQNRNKNDTDKLSEGSFDACFVIGDSDGERVFSDSDIRVHDSSDLEKEISSLLAKVDLDDKEGQFRKQYPKNISGGQGQRVMISLALASEPEILIADEPSTGLDLTKQKEIVNLFLQYKNQNRSIVLISHDMNFLRHLVDSYTVMYAGVDVEHIPDNNIATKKNLHPYTEKLQTIAKKEDSEFDYIDKDVPDPFRKNIKGCPFAPRCHKKTELNTNNGIHICEEIFPPLIQAESGEIVATNDIEKLMDKHLIRCWLYHKETTL